MWCHLIRFRRGSRRRSSTKKASDIFNVVTNVTTETVNKIHDIVVADWLFTKIYVAGRWDITCHAGQFHFYERSCGERARNPLSNKTSKA